MGESTRTPAERIVDALAARSSGIYPRDYDDQLVADVDAMSERYGQLRGTHAFSEADRIAKTEFIDRVIQEAMQSRKAGVSGSLVASGEPIRAPDDDEVASQ